MLPLLSITFVGSLLTLEWRGREKQVIQIPKHDIACDFIALLLQWNLNVSFWAFQTCKLYTPEYLITELRHWALGPGYVSWNLPPNLIFWRWAALHSLLLLVAQTVPVEDTCFHSSICLPNSREIIIRSVSLAYLPLCAFSFQGGQSSESPAKILFSTQNVVSGNSLFSWFCLTVFSEGNNTPIHKYEDLKYIILKFINLYVFFKKNIHVPLEWKKNLW